MARISLIANTLGGHTHNAVEDPDLILLQTFTKAASDFDLEDLLEFGSVPVEIIVSGHGSEIITVYNDSNVATRMMKETGIGNAASETHAFQSIAVTLLPNHSRISGPIDASSLLCNKVLGQTELGRERHIDVPSWNTIEVCLLDVNET